MKTGEIPCPIRAVVWYNFPVCICNHYETESIDDIGRKLMPRSRVCDIESLITLSPNAVIFLFRFLVGACTLQVKGAEMLGNRVLWGISTYLAGLIILDRKRTATRIAGQFGFISHDQLWRLAKLFGDIELAINQWWINFLLSFDLAHG